MYAGLNEWYVQNKLVIHKSKSSVMLATTRQRILHIDNNNLDVHIGDLKLVQSDIVGDPDTQNVR